MNERDFLTAVFVHLRVLDSGYSVLSWWDRTQGDGRGACNSTIMLKGEHTTAELLAALAEHFPAVLANLERAGVKLVDVTLAAQPPTKDHNEKA